MNREPAVSEHRLVAQAAVTDAGQRRMAELTRGLRRGLIRTVPIAYLLLCALPYAVLIPLVPEPYATPTLNYLYPYVDLDDEANVATWFSSSLLLLCALAAGALAFAAGKRGARARVLPAAAALIFLYLSMDETGRLHELLDRMVAHRIASAFTEVPHAARVWALFALPLLLLVAAVVLLAVRRGPLVLRGVSGCFLIGFGAWALALVLEIALGAPLWAAGRLSLYRLEVLFEESAEVAGTFLFLIGLLQGLEAQFREGAEAAVVAAPPG